VSTITKNRLTRTFGRKTSPPSKKESQPTAEKSTLSSADTVSFSQSAEAKPARKGLMTTAFVAGAAALSLATLLSPIGSEVAAEPAALEHPGSPFEMVRDADGKVVFHLGIGDEVVEPLAPTHKEAPHLTDRAYSKRGQTVCEQALQLGGNCDFEHAASVPTPYGDLIVEQNTDYSLDIYSNDGGHVGLKLESGGVDVKTENGSAYFLNDGSIIYR
jgi:hypothetical protein